MKMNHEWTRIDQKTDGPPSTTSCTKILLQCCALGVTMSWDDGSWERGRPARTKPGTAWAIFPTWINRERNHGSPSAWPMLFPQTGWLPAASHGSSAAAKGAGCGRDARAPRANHSPLEGESQKPSRQAKADAVGGGRRATSQKADVRPLGNSRSPASRAPALPCGSFEEKRPIINEDEPLVSRLAVDSWL